MISKRQFADAYNQANKAATGREAPASEITEAYEVHTGFAADMKAPNAVPVFRTQVKDGKLDWDIDLNRDGKLEPTRGYFNPKGDGSAQPTL